MAPLSLSILNIDYWKKTRELLVTFVSGSYAFENVPMQVYDEFVVAPSHGMFFDAHIRDRYRYRRVSGC
jgi:hypothetical protein